MFDWLTSFNKGLPPSCMISLAWVWKSGYLSILITARPGYDTSFPTFCLCLRLRRSSEKEGREEQKERCYNISWLISRISFNAGTFHGFVNCNSDNWRKVKLPFHFIYELFAPWEFNFDNSYDFDKDPTKYGYRSPPFLNRPLLMIRLWSDHGKLPGK